MARLPKYNSTKLFHKIAREVKLDFIEKEGRKPNLKEWNEIQKWTSKNLYYEHKGTSVNKVTIEEIHKEIDLLTKPKKERICGDAREVNPADYALVDWWDIILAVTSLPIDVQLRVNAGEFGITKIEQNRLINPQTEIIPIIANIRVATKNKSGPYFSGSVNVVPNKKDDGKTCSYFIDYMLYDKDGNAVGVVDTSEIIIKPSVEETEQEREAKIRQRRAQEKKREIAMEAKKKKRPDVKPKKKPIEVRDRVAEMKMVESMYKEGSIDKETLAKLLEAIVTSKKYGGKV